MDSPRWAVRAAHLAAVTPLPSSIWRLFLAAGLPAGYTATGYAALDLDGWGTAYVVFLSVGTELAALLTLGLVRPWGEVVPRWVPVLGGRTVPARPVVVLASIGAGVLVVAWTPFVAWWALPHPELTDAGRLWIGVLYLPLVLWGPLLAAVTVSYRRRRNLLPEYT